jgi:hypothetical protein
MKSREILIAVLVLATMGHTAAAQPKKKKIQAEPPPLEKVVAGTNSPQSGQVLPDLIAVRPQMPLGPQDVLKSYEIAMNLLADKTSNDFSVIVQAQQANQITREQAEYLLQQRYQVAMMQYQVLCALHDVLKHDIDEAEQQSKPTLKVASSDEVLVVPLPGSPSGSR